MNPSHAVDRQRISVIVPVHSGAAVLPRSLGALVASSLPRDRWELIVVDDASADDSAMIAAEYADTVVRLSGSPRGPAYARNRGCEVSTGDILVFVDADVCVHHDVLERFRELFLREPQLSAAFGSYDANPPAFGLVSQFRNLLHHHVHQSHPGEAETFWAGCGAVRREAIFGVHLFDEWHYSRPQIEDIDIGRRLRLRGGRILLRPEIQCTHLKRWSLFGMIATDLTGRGIPWTRVLLQERSLGRFHSLNLTRRERFSAMGVTLGMLLVVLAVLLGLWRLLPLAIVPLGALLVTHHTFYRLLLRRGIVLALVGVPLHVIYYLTATLAAGVGYLAHQLLGEPAPLPDAEAYEALSIRHWPPGPSRQPEHLWSLTTDRGASQP
jgi:glycosyltransferase involved in cell wall biosynthesis